MVGSGRTQRRAKESKKCPSFALVSPLVRSSLRKSYQILGGVVESHHCRPMDSLLDNDASSPSPRNPTTHAPYLTHQPVLNKFLTGRILLEYLDDIIVQICNRSRLIIIFSVAITRKIRGGGIVAYLKNIEIDVIELRYPMAERAQKIDNRDFKGGGPLY
ncbi:hypothetical protein OCU04_008396 [Sclerotinia nivalis]|uniref:Uncharacterized protein n=1 Tax=Sclerotinia nivalis TaxID=352851 RepID=A0A9X0AHZ8_9HELO|nr:hypothetical protein OCU04_008396 [Sclerotinia nivalis]